MGESNKRVDMAAARLREAEAVRRPVQPLTDEWPDLRVDEAYAVQQHNIELRRAAGETVAGHKIGLTAKVMQEQFGVDEPDYGHLLNSMVLAADAPLDLAELIDPQIEIEPAFVLGRRLAGPGVTAADVLAATEYVVTCFEVIDSRIDGWRIKLQDTVADNGSSARVMLGSARQAPEALDEHGLDTALELDGRVVETGNTRAILGHPANGVAWLANALGSYGIALEAGHLVLPGTCTRAFRLAGCRQARGTIAGLGEVVLGLINEPTVPARTG